MDVSDYNCVNVADRYGGRGVTLWGPVSAYLAPNGGTVTWAFTGTHPKCYQSRDNCNFTYTIHTTQTSAQNDVGPIACELNKYTNPPRLRSMGNRYHSRIAGRDLTETIDIGSGAVPEYHDAELNTLTFTNNDPSVGVYINDFRIIRVYGICGMDKEAAGCCKQPQDPGCWDNNCGVEESTGIAGNLDWSRRDYPCNLESPGNRLSFTKLGPDNHVKIIDPGQTVSWTWTNPPIPSGAPYNYVGPSVCLFNLNNIQLYTQPSSGDDVEFGLSVNSSPLAYYRMSKVKAHPSAAASVDLANTAPFSSYYHDSPNSVNVVEFKNNSTVSLLLCDGTPDGQECDACYNDATNCRPLMGKIDIYRVYQTTNNLQDNFSDANFSSKIWDPVVVNSGYVWPVNGQLEVTVPSGSGWAQAGLVSKYQYNMLGEIGANQQGLEAKIDVTQLSYLDEMLLMVCNTKATSSDPVNESNWYRIMKTRRGNALVVQNRINGTLSTKLSIPWISSTGQLRISVSTGSIALYENGQLKYAEPFALPSARCYVYPYASSDRAISVGTDRFDNYALYPTQPFRDDFTDGNYNGWTVDSGSWEITSDKKLRSTAQTSHIHANITFSANRHVKTDIQTITAGGNSWDVPWLYVKEQDGNNNVYALIHTNGTIELAMFYQGQKTMWTASSSLNPYSTHVLAVSIIGTNAKVWVDGTLYIDTTNSNLANLAGYIGFYTPLSTGSFDNVVVFGQ